MIQSNKWYTISESAKLLSKDIEQIRYYIKIGVHKKDEIKELKSNRILTRKLLKGSALLRIGEFYPNKKSIKK